MVPAFIWGEEIADVGEGVEPLIKCPCSNSAEMGFELVKGHLNRVEIWRVWRQEEEPTALRPECGSGLDVFVCGEVVADHDRSGLNFWHQTLADVGCKSLPIHCSSDDPGRDEALVGQSGDEGLRSACPEGSIHFQPLTTKAAAS